MPSKKTDLIADLKEMLVAALELGDYAKVQKFAGYLAELSGEKETPKAEKPAVKRGPKPKVKEEKAAAKPAKVTKVKKPAKAKNGSKRGAAKFPVGTKLKASLKGAEYIIEVKKNGYEYNGELFPALSRVIDKAFGKGKAMHLRNFANWKVVE